MCHTGRKQKKNHTIMFNTVQMVWVRNGLGARTLLDDSPRKCLYVSLFWHQSAPPEAPSSAQVWVSHQKLKPLLFVCSFSKVTLTTTAIRRICLSRRSTPDMCEWSPGNGTSASLYAWSCWAVMTKNSPVIIYQCRAAEQQNFLRTVRSAQHSFLRTIILVAAGALTLFD